MRNCLVKTWKSFFHTPLKVILLLTTASQSCMSHKLYWSVHRTCPLFWSVRGGLLEEVWFRTVPCLQRLCLGSGWLCLNTITERSREQPTSSWQMAVCVSLRVFLPTFGWGFWLVGGREVEFREEEEVETCGERSAEAQLVRPPLQPAAASDEPVSSPPARLLFLFPSCHPRPHRPALPLSRPPADSAQLFHAFSSPPPTTIHPDPQGKGKTLTHTHL